MGLDKLSTEDIRLVCTVLNDAASTDPELVTSQDRMLRQLRVLGFKNSDIRTIYNLWYEREIEWYITNREYMDRLREEMYNKKEMYNSFRSYSENDMDGYSYCRNEDGTYYYERMGNV